MHLQPKYCLLFLTTMPGTQPNTSKGVRCHPPDVPNETPIEVECEGRSLVVVSNERKMGIDGLFSRVAVEYPRRRGKVSRVSAPTQACDGRALERKDFDVLDSTDEEMFNVTSVVYFASVPVLRITVVVAPPVPRPEHDVSDGQLLKIQALFDDVLENTPTPEPSFDIVTPAASCTIGAWLFTGKKRDTGEVIFTVRYNHVRALGTRYSNATVAKCYRDAVRAGEGLTNPTETHMEYISLHNISAESVHYLVRNAMLRERGTWTEADAHTAVRLSYGTSSEENAVIAVVSKELEAGIMRWDKRRVQSMTTGEQASTI